MSVPFPAVSGVLNYVWGPPGHWRPYIYYRLNNYVAEDAAPVVDRLDNRIVLVSESTSVLV